MKNKLDLYFKHVERSFGEGTYSKDMYELSFLSILNSYAIQFLPIINYNGTLSPFSMSSLIFADSGLGKNQSINFLKEITDEVEKIVNNVYGYRYEILNNIINENNVSNTDEGNFKIKAKPKDKSSIKTLFEKFPKEITFFSRNGTVEGLANFWQAYSTLAIGSIGVESSEFADFYAEDSFKKLLETCSEFWNDISPGSLKVTASRGSDKAKNIQSSIRLHGSFARFKKTPALFDSFQTFIVSSLARRTLFFMLNKEESNRARLSKIKYKESIIKNKKKLACEDGNASCKESGLSPEMIELKQLICHDVIQNYADLFISNSKLDANYNFKPINIEFNINRAADYELCKYSLQNDKIAQKYHDLSSEKHTRRANELESRHFKALRIAALSSFFKPKNNRIIDKEDILYGIEVAEKSGKYFAEISKPTIIVDDVCKHLDKIEDKLTIKSLEDAEVIPRNLTKGRLNDLFDRCKEQLYQNNRIFRSTLYNNESIPQVWIEPLEETKDEIAYFTYSTEEAMNNALMTPASVPFYDILKIPEIKKISTGGFINDHRSMNNICKLGNILIYDCDNGDQLSIRQAMDRLQGLTGFIYPTKSNNKPKIIRLKNKQGEEYEVEKTCNRYRIVLLCKQHLPFGENKEIAEKEFKEIYTMIANHYEIPFDPACRDLSRFVWIPEEAKTEIVIQRGRLSEPNQGSMIDLRYYIKNLKMFHDLRSSAKVFENSKFWKSVGVKNILEKCIMNAIQTGNRNTSLLIMALRLKDYGLDFDKIRDYVYLVDDKFPQGSLQSENKNEIENTILKTLKLRMEKEKK